MINLQTGAGGRVYQIWQQQQNCSCGVASAWMARGIARQMSFAEEEWDLAVRMYLGAVNTAVGAASSIPEGPMSFDPRAFASVPRNQIQSNFGSNFSRGGLSCNQLAAALRNEGLQAEIYSNGGNPCSVIDTKIAYNKPAISFVRWAGGGAHFVVVGRCVPRQVTFLDPWTGRINEEPNDGRYRASYNRGVITENIYISA